MISLEAFGWSEREEELWKKLTAISGCVPGRVVADFGSSFTVALPEYQTARVAGSLIRAVTPKTGDWVAVDTGADQAIIRGLLPRQSELVRGQVGRAAERQVVAANVDVALVVQPLDHDFSVPRLERYLFQLTSQSITPVIVLNKIDQVDDVQPYLDALAAVRAKIVAISALHDSDLSRFRQLIAPDQTVVVLGSSGAGKSTLVNRLLGEDRQATQEVRHRDSKGRHTTVHRELFLLPGGGVIIDTPGVRELQLWGSIDDLDVVFSDIIRIMQQCRYSSCTHTVEDGCAIQGGLLDGMVDAERYRLYVSFHDELRALERRRRTNSHLARPRRSIRQLRRQGRNIDESEDI